MNLGRTYTYKGKTLTITGWSEELGIPHSTLHRWLLKYPAEIVLSGNVPRIAKGGLPVQTFTCEGKTLTVEQWAEELGLTVSAVYRRLGRYQPEVALSKSFKQSRPQTKILTCNGKTGTVEQWANWLGISRAALRRRIREYQPEVALHENFQFPSPAPAPHTKWYTLDGKTLSISGWARELGVTKVAISLRLKDYPPEVALSRDFKKTQFVPPPRQGKLYSYGDTALPVSEWAKRLNISASVLRYRLENFPPEVALRADFQKPKKLIEFAGENHTLSEWAQQLGLGVECLRSRLRKYPPEIAFHPDFIVVRHSAKCPSESPTDSCPF